MKITRNFSREQLVFCENKNKIGERKVERFIVFFAIDEKLFFKYLENVF